MRIHYNGTVIEFEPSHVEQAAIDAMEVGKETPLFGHRLVAVKRSDTEIEVWYPA